MDDELVGVEGDMEGDAEGAEEEGDGGDQHGIVTSFEFGEFAVLPLEEVGDGGYLLKTGFLLKLYILAENQLIFYLIPLLGLSILQLRKSVTVILEVSNAEG